MPKIMLTNPEVNVNPATEVVTDWLVAAAEDFDDSIQVARTSWGKFAVTPKSGRTFSVTVEEV